MSKKGKIFKYTRRIEMRDKKNWRRLIALAISAVMLTPAQVGYAEESGVEDLE